MRVLILLAVIGAALAVPKNANRIVGGSPTTIEEYPFMANMQFGLIGVFHTSACGGSLITSTTVLSAAHCYYGDSPAQWVVRLGSTNSSSGGTVHEVSRIILHENYIHRLLVNDVALIRLRVAATLSSAIGLARLAGTTYQLPDDTRVYAAGWGHIRVGGPSSSQLLHVDVNIINHRLCTVRYAHLKTQPGFENWPDVTPEMLCVGILDVGGKDACQGDSGGPVIHDKDIVVGITSWGYRCADPFYPGVNARVSSYTNWIVNNTIA
ncbi:trypsin, alkaline C-like [Vanessa atalanta]|uniref:trypsin, alkaline C-like n=1 Tax=Vanessa atalanta TaxID=42275 RepID=UPI001FCD962E|nr:trypsin, alkaline C-like [Vanessa atalanta]